MSSFVPEKNHRFLLSVFKLLAGRVTDLKLWLVGDGPLRNELIFKVREAGLEQKVAFWGYRKDAAALLSRSAVMVMPSLIEGLPAVILEAFAARIPVVASDVGGVGEVVKNNETGFCLKAGTEEDYVSAIQQLLENSSVRTNITMNAFNLVSTQYTMTAISNRFYNSYKALIR